MSVISEQSETTSAPETTPSPMDKAVVLDLGKKKRKLIKRLRKGRGRLLDQVESHIEELRASGAIEASAQPVIVVVAEKKPKAPWL